MSGQTKQVHFGGEHGGGQDVELGVNGQRTGQRTGSNSSKLDDTISPGSPGSQSNYNDGNNIEAAGRNGHSSMSLSLGNMSLEHLMRNNCAWMLREDLQMLILAQVSRALPVIAGVGCVLFIIILIATPSNWKTNKDASGQTILDRESNRGVFVSVLIAILLNLIGALMFYVKVKESLVVTNYGFILGPVIGYLLDQSIGTDDGFRHVGTWGGFTFTFASLIDGNFMRYIVTVFLDLFISNPLQDVMKNQVKKIGVIKYLKNEEDNFGREKPEWLIKYDNFVVLNYPSILQSIISFVTFNAYTNQTRFAWAYASSDLERQFRIPPGTIMLSAAIAAVLYLNFYTIMDYISEREYFDVNTKLIYVLSILGLLYALNATDTIEAPVEDEPDEYYTQFLGDSKWVFGLLLFTCFVLYGFVYPLYTRLGCCGYYKPKSVDDHIGEDDDAVKSVAEVKHKVSDDVLDKVEEILKTQGIDITEARKQYEEEQQLKRKKSKRRR